MEMQLHFRIYIFFQKQPTEIFFKKRYPKFPVVPTEVFQKKMLYGHWFHKKVA